MAVTYEEAVRCTSNGPTPGSLANVAQWERTTGLGNMGICSCRNAVGGDFLSVHSECRAADLACNAYRRSQKVQGDAYADWLAAHDDELGCQGIIWNRLSWRSGRGWRQYSGLNPHTDHLHVELTRAKAVRPSTLWFTDWRTGAPIGDPGEEGDVTTDELFAALGSPRGQLLLEAAAARAIRGLVDDETNTASRLRGFEERIDDQLAALRRQVQRIDEQVGP